jgi:site-specific recombinase XerD
MKLSQGNPIHVGQQMLGHVSVATTGRYLHARLSINPDEVA